MKKFYKKDGRLFLENGSSKVAVGFMGHFENPHSPGRVGKLLVVQQVMKGSMTNLIQPGRLLAISFPSEKINKDKYTWGSKEEFQMQGVKIQLAENRRKDLITGMDMGKQE